jgi:surfactin synthase thioesterase subunit
MPVLRVDFAIAETYGYYDEPPLPCALWVFGCLGDHVTTRQKLQAVARADHGGFRVADDPWRASLRK